MIHLDKGPISDAAGCTFTWNQGGRVDALGMDRGAGYRAEESYRLLQALRITNIGASAGKPWLRAMMERAFGTIHKTLLQRFSGRTFSDIVAKGENDAAARASIRLEDLLYWLVRWIVDIYHQTRHSGLYGATPREAWDRAVAECAPGAGTSREMRLAFGVRRTCKLGPAGIRRRRLDCLTEALATFARARPVRELDAMWWEHDIGEIEVRLGEDRWISVAASDEQWIGRNFEDLKAFHNIHGVRAPGWEDARLRAISDIDRASLDARRLRSLAIESVNDSNFDYYDALFQRHVVLGEQGV